MKSPSREKVSPVYCTLEGGTICTSLLVLTWRTRKLCCPLWLATWTRYLPSGEMAALSAVPVLVRRAILIVREELEGRLDEGCVAVRRYDTARIASATKPITPTTNATAFG